MEPTKNHCLNRTMVIGMHATRLESGEHRDAAYLHWLMTPFSIFEAGSTAFLLSSDKDIVIPSDPGE
ncbi:hypothetical protein STEG23_018381 [Scotinomys teguina]